MINNLSYDNILELVDIMNNSTSKLEDIVNNFSDTAKSAYPNEISKITAFFADVKNYSEYLRNLVEMNIKSDAVLDNLKNRK